MLFLNRKGVIELLKNSKKITLRELNNYGAIHDSYSEEELDETAYEYNPRGLPSKWETQQDLPTDTKTPQPTDSWFSPVPIWINEEIYGVDMEGLPKDCFDQLDDLNFDEMLVELFLR